jgi:hypothetical protein
MGGGLGKHSRKPTVDELELVKLHSEIEERGIEIFDEPSTEVTQLSKCNLALEKLSFIPLLMHGSSGESYCIFICSAYLVF